MAEQPARRMSVDDGTFVFVPTDAASVWSTSDVTRVRVNVTDEYLASLIRNPKVGLEELVDNALDADATAIDIAFRRGLGEAVTGITISDDGEGMTWHRATSAFGNLGDSWKIRDRRTKSGRGRRGSKGSGRWAAFSLGEEVTWTSVADAPVGTAQEKVVVSGSSRSLGEFDIAEPVALTGDTGTVVDVREVRDDAQILDSDVERRRLTELYALSLRRQPSLSITVDGKPLRADDVIVEVTRIPVDVPELTETDRAHTDEPTHAPIRDLTQNQPEPASVGDAEPLVWLTVVEWHPKVRGIRPTLVLTDADGEALHDHIDFIPKAPWLFTAFLAWDGFEDHRPNLPSPITWQPPLSTVVEAGLEVLRQHITDRKNAAEVGILTSWKLEDSYPFGTTPPRGPIEEAERDLFDLVAVTAASAIQGSDVKGRKFALRMLREAMRSDDTNLTHVLQQVLDLDADQVDDLSNLLRRTTLPALLKAGRVVTHRLDILDGLHTILHEPAFAARVGEKRHLHEVVAAEPWVFGDEYTTSVSERTLPAVLRAHRAKLGSERVIVDPNADPAVGAGPGSDSGSSGEVHPVDDGPRPTVSGREGRIDLMLTRVSPLEKDLTQHLIVELKRPSVTLSAAEITQLEEYAYEISNDSRFHGQTVSWDFVLIGTKMSAFAQDKAEKLERQADRSFRLRVTTWDRLLRARRHQMKFVERALADATSGSHGLDELRRIHADRLPDEVLNCAPQPVPPSAPSSDS